MFFPKTMSEIELIVPSKDMLAVTKVLSGHGVFHQTDSNYPGVATGSQNTWQEKASAYGGLERRIQLVMQALSVEEGQPPASESDSIVARRRCGERPRSAWASWTNSWTASGRPTSS